MKAVPFTFEIDSPDFIPSTYDNHIQRRLSSMKGQYLDQDTYTSLLADADPLLYEVYELQRPTVPGELLHGISIVHPGKVGSEYHMTNCLLYTSPSPRD